MSLFCFQIKDFLFRQVSSLQLQHVLLIFFKNESSRLSVIMASRIVLVLFSLFIVYRIIAQVNADTFQLIHTEHYWNSCFYVSFYSFGFFPFFIYAFTLCTRTGCGTKHHFTTECDGSLSKLLSCL